MGCHRFAAGRCSRLQRESRCTGSPRALAPIQKSRGALAAGDPPHGGGYPKTSATSATPINILFFYRGLPRRGYFRIRGSPLHPRQLRLRGLLWAAWRRQSRAQHQRHVASVARLEAGVAGATCSSEAGVAIFAKRIVRIFRQQGARLLCDVYWPALSPRRTRMRARCLATGGTPELSG